MTGFIIALFTEMWGLPLSLLVITSITSGAGLPYQFDNLIYFFTKARTSSDIAFTNMPAAFFIEYTIARGLTLLSILPIICGWNHLKKNVNSGLVTNGPYANSRNPQYVGFILFTIGMVLYWPTLITILMGCILCVAYYKLAIREEKELEQKYDGPYLQYAEKVPRFVGRNVLKIFRLPRNLRFIEKVVAFTLLIPFILWFAESLLGLLWGEAFVLAYWFPIAYLFPIHIGVVISIVLLLSIGLLQLVEKFKKNRFI